MKIKWRVDPPPSGPYKSFFERGWPTAVYESGKVCAWIECVGHGYVPQHAANGNHPPLTLVIADHSAGNCWKRVRAKKTFATVRELKEALPKLLEKYPHLVPENDK